MRKIFHVSVRTLRYWREIGLLSTQRGEYLFFFFFNYRLYGTAECTRIEQILIYQATGMKLAEIKDLLKTPASRIRCLQQQRRLLLERKSQVDGMIQALDTLLEDEMNEQKLTPKK
ncbi:MAG: MerR family transcriptional regulator [Lawsonella clevelandensis]